jgi:hypothetical protein
MRDSETAKVHIDGAQRMMKYRGKLGELESDARVRAMVFWLVHVWRKTVSHSVNNKHSGSRQYHVASLTFRRASQLQQNILWDTSAPISKYPNGLQPT